jgi:hypothetical protein
MTPTETRFEVALGTVAVSGLCELIALFPVQYVMVVLGTAATRRRGPRANCGRPPPRHRYGHLHPGQASPSRGAGEMGGRADGVAVPGPKPRGGASVAAADAKGIPPLSRERIKEFSAFSRGLPLLTRNRKHFEPLEPLGLVLL